MKAGLLALGLAVLATAALAAYGYRLQQRGPLEQQMCEFLTVEMLKSPASYSRVAVRPIGTSREPVLVIEYDAANSYGALIRGRTTCGFGPPGTDGRRTLVSLERDGVAADADIVRLSNEWWEAARRLETLR